MTTPEVTHWREMDGQLTDEFRSKYPQFDWSLYKDGQLACVRYPKCLGHYFLPSTSAEKFFFARGGLWYSNNRVPRLQRSPERKWHWPSEDHYFMDDGDQSKIYFVGRDINVETETFMLHGRPFKPHYSLRNRDLPYVLDAFGYIRRITWFDVPDDVEMGKAPRKFVQTFRNYKGAERIIETGLTTDGRTYVLVNRKIEAEMDADLWWANSQNMQHLERRDGIVVPRQVIHSGGLPNYDSSEWDTDEHESGEQKPDKRNLDKPESDKKLAEELKLGEAEFDEVVSEGDVRNILESASGNENMFKVGIKELSLAEK